MSPLIPTGPPPDLSTILATPGGAYVDRLERAAQDGHPIASRLLIRREERLASTRFGGRGSKLRMSRSHVWNEDNPWEISELIDCVDYLREHPKVTIWLHVPNERGSKAMRGILSRAGVRSGVPDLYIDHAFMIGRRTFPGMRIELKRRKGGRLKPEQRAFLEAYRDAGYIAEECAGAGPAVALIDWGFGALF